MAAIVAAMTGLHECGNRRSPNWKYTTMRKHTHLEDGLATLAILIVIALVIGGL